MPHHKRNAASFLFVRKVWQGQSQIITSGLQLAAQIRMVIAFGVDAGMNEMIAAVMTMMGSTVYHIPGEATVNAARESRKRKE